MNRQIDELNSILKKYDEGGMLVGEAPCTKDLIACTDHDFTVVSLISIIAIFVIIMLVQKSATLPIFLVVVIELAIAANSQRLSKRMSRNRLNSWSRSMWKNT